MKNKVFLLFLFFTPLIVCSQNDIPEAFSTQYKIKGFVMDEMNSTPVEMSVATLYNAKDNSIVKGVFTDEKGFFILDNIPLADYNVTITLLGYDTARISIPQSRFSKRDIVLDTIRLRTSDIRLSSVTITAEPPELVVKEDTLEYNAAAFKVAEGAVVEDLIKKLPGMEVDEDGNIKKPDGKQVKRVFVDGKEFFGNDPKMATKNLTADIVDKVQVIDKKSDLAILTGVDDDDEETIINITIKKGMKKGWMGNVTSGAGMLTQEEASKNIRYNENLMINRFLESDQISFIANADNINNQGSTDKGNNVRSSRGGGAGRSGVVSSNSFGVNTAKIVNDKIKLGGNIRYNYSDSYAENDRFRQNLLKDSTSYRRRISSNRDYSNNLVFDGKLEYEMDSTTKIVFTPHLSYNYSKSNTHSYQTTMAGDKDSTKVNESTSHNRLKSDGLDVRMQLDISKKLSPKGRNLSFSATFSSSGSSGSGINNSENTYFFAPNRNQLLDQISQSEQDRNSYNFRVTYVEPLGRNNFLNFSYNIALNNTGNEKETYDYNTVTEEYDILNPNYSKSSDTKTINQNFRLNFRSVRTNYTYNIGLNVAPTNTSSKSYIKDWHSAGNDSILNDIPGRTATNYAPQLDFTYRFSKDKEIRRNLRFMYNGRTSQPSVSQLDPTPNNTNPLNIRSGNPDLLPSFNHSISLNYNNYSRTKQSSLNINLQHTFIQNQIINYTTYEENTGVQYSMPINENGSWITSGNILYSKPLDEKKRWRFSTNTRGNYNNKVGYTNVEKQSQKNISKTISVGEDLSLSYSNDVFYGQFRGRLNYSKTTNTVVTNQQGQESFNYNLSYNTNVNLPYSWSISSDITYIANRGLSSGYNKNEVLWNAQINKQIFNRKQGSVRLQVNDILQQRLNIRRNVTANYIEDVQTNALTGYFMVSFSYRFNNIGGRNKQRQRTSYDSMDDSEGEIRMREPRTEGSREGRGRGGRF